MVGTSSVPAEAGGSLSVWPLWSTNEFQNNSQGFTEKLCLEKQKQSKIKKIVNDMERERDSTIMKEDQLFIVLFLVSLH